MIGDQSEIRYCKDRPNNDDQRQVEIVKGRLCKVASSKLVGLRRILFTHTLDQINERARFRSISALGPVMLSLLVAVFSAPPRRGGVR